MNKQGELAMQTAKLLLLSSAKQQNNSFQLPAHPVSLGRETGHKSAVCMCTWSTW